MQRETCRRRTILLSAAGVASIGLAGCSNDPTGTETAASPTEDTVDETPTATEEATPTATTTDEPTATSTPTASPTATPTDRPDVAAEVIVAPDRSLTFSPDVVEIAVGETVRWLWEGTGHNVKPRSTPSGTEWSGTPGSDSETYDQGYVHTHTFEVAGTYEYVCVPHEGAGMTGTVVVN